MIANPPGPDRRRGFGLIEMAISTLMVAAAMVVTLQLIGWVALEGRAVARRERALREASNLAERIAVRPWDELTTEAFSRLGLSDEMSALPGSSLVVRVATSEDTPSRKRITIEVRWDDRVGRPESPVRLVAWVHKKGGPAR